MAKNELPDIFHYVDFRKYLEAYYLKRKAFDHGFSHTYICFRLGQKRAKSYFNNIIKGRAVVTSTFIDRLISLFELNNDEAKYFRALVNYNQASSSQEKEFFFDQLVSLNKTPHQVIEKNAYNFYKEWYHSAIRALLDIINVTDDYKAIASRIFPRITVKQARDSIKLLKQLGLITKNKKGHWKPTEKVIITGELIKDAIIRQFQMKCLEHAKNVLTKDNMSHHRNITLTISMSERAYDRIIERVQQFKSEVRSIVHKDELPPSRVYHINLNLFPMSS